MWWDSAVLLVVMAVGAIVAAAVALLRPDLPTRLPTVTVWVGAAVGAVAVGASGAAPTGADPLDVVLRVLFGASVPLAAARAGNVATIWIVVVATATLLFASAPAEAATALVGGAFVALAVAGIATPAAASLTAAAAMGPLAHAEWAVTGDSTVAMAVAVAPVLVMGLIRTRRPMRGRIALAIAGVVLLVGFGAAAGLLAALSARSDVDRAVDLATSGIDRLGDDDARARTDLLDAAGAFESAEDTLSAWWARSALVIPGVAQQTRAVTTMASAGAELARTAADETEDADVESIRPRSGTVDLAALAAVQGPIERSLDSLVRAESRLQDVHSPLLLEPVAERLTELRHEVADARVDAELAAQVIRVAPAMLGADGPRRYFVAFQNPAEARGNGGYMGNWAELTAEDGRITLTRSGRIRELFEARRDDVVVEGLPELVDIYGYRTRFWGAHNYSPDNPSVSSVISQLYPASGGAPIDGVISLTPGGMAGFLELTGPIEVAGYPERLTSENAERILLHEQYLEFPRDSNEQRTEFLAAAVETTFEQLLGGDLPGPRAFTTALAPAVRARDLQMWSSHHEEMDLFRRIGIDGSSERGNVDSFGVTNQNFNGNKIDWFLQRSIAYDIDWDPSTGAVDGTMTVTFENDAPAAGLPASIIGWGGDVSAGQRPVADGANFMQVALYTTFSAESVTVDGAPQETQTVRELDHSVERFFLSVPPQGRRVVEVQFSGAVSVGGAYVLEPLRQPTAQADRFSMHVRAPDGWEVSNSREPHDSGGRAIEVSGTSEEDLQVPLIVARAGGTSRGVLDRLIGDR
jgi:hypothetical protein